MSRVRIIIAASSKLKRFACSLQLRRSKVY